MRVTSARLGTSAGSSVQGTAEPPTTHVRVDALPTCPFVFPPQQYAEPSVVTPHV